MVKNKRLLTSLLVAIVLIGALVAPLAASAGKMIVRSGMMLVPRHASVPYRLQVGEFSVTVPVGALPKGGPVIIRTMQRDDWFQVDFLPERQFAAPVMMDFGTAPVIYYEHNGTQDEIWTSDLDGDGQVGEIYSNHFSRYSGWH